jgi:sterol desaturase/sphingolipid hydroxylase (fatty acid hydroxylase superfamily)
MLLLELVIQFLIWTLLVYLIHKIIHRYPKQLGKFHFDHHSYVMKNYNRLGWHWSNLLLFNNNFYSTADLWLTEIIPLLITSWLFSTYWLVLIYWVWAAFIQERIEHLYHLNLYPYLTSGNWHMKHHHNGSCNFGIFFPIWDITFGTNNVGK